MCAKRKTNQPAMTLDFVTSVLGVPVISANTTKKRDHIFSSVITDSREVSKHKGCLFLALKGEKFDGHDFIEAAIKSGATGIIYSSEKLLPEKLSKLSSVFFFTVRDTLEAYRSLAMAWRRQFKIPIVAIAGSVGKTTTKEILAAVLSSKWTRILKTKGSRNGFVGIPMTLLELSADHEAAVIEIGIDEPGAMEKHLELVAPTMSLVTTVAPEHLEKLGSIENVAKEEALALSYTANSNGVAVINLNDEWLSPYFSSIDVDRIGFSLADVTSAVHSSDDILVGTLQKSRKPELRCQGLGLTDFTVPLPMSGAHNASNLLGALAAALKLSLTPKEIIRGLSSFVPPEGRSEIMHLPTGVTVICDYYNANPASVAAGLKLLDELAANNGDVLRWACLGDMLELGSDEEYFHRAIAKNINKSNIQNILLLGKRMRWLFDELSATPAGRQVFHFNSHADLSTYLLKYLKSNDCVLIKGSRGMKMEEVWKAVNTPT
ncbi:MAG: UDP-N-acetylmuramoyl-tripeptide--D-alanyl-D-alanine ligase [Bdellovibrionota bacterium]